jgi:hypothetical protein
MRQNNSNYLPNLKAQRGATMWSTVTIALMVGFFALMAFKLAPVYLDHGIIRKSMQEIANQQGFKDMTQQQILSAMQKRMMIDNIRGFSSDAFSVSRDRGGEKFIVINYSQKIPIFANISALVEFEEEIRTARK